MKDLRKIVLMCLIPVLLTIIFIACFTVPAITQYMGLTKKINQEKSSIKETQSRVEELRANKKLANELAKLNTALAGFDVEFPEEFRDEIFLIDLEIFANEAVNRIVQLQSSSEKNIEITDPNAPETAKKSKKRAQVKDEELLPVQIIEKSFDINTVAYYSEIINFVRFLESYQRKINISGISAKIFKDDTESLNPKIEIKIAASVYKSVINEIKEENSKNAEIKK